MKNQKIPEQNKKDEDSKLKQDSELPNDNTEKKDIITKKNFFLNIIYSSPYSIYISPLLTLFSITILGNINFTIQMTSQYLINLSGTNFFQYEISKKAISLILLSQCFYTFSKSVGYTLISNEFYKIKIKKLLLITIFISMGCNFFLFSVTTYSFFIKLLYVIYSLSSGLVYVPLLKQNWIYFPSNKGLTSGSYNCFEFINIIFLFPCFDPSKNYFEIKIINIFFSFLLISLFLYINDKDQFFFEGGKSYSEYNQKKEEEEKLNENKMEQFEVEVDIPQSNILQKAKKFLFDLISKRFILLFFTYLLLLESIYIISLSYSSYATKYNLLMFSSKVNLYTFFILYCISSLVFGILYDFKKSIRTLLSVIIFLSIISILLFIPSLYFSKFFLWLICVINAISLSGIKTLFYTLVNREFLVNENNFYLLSLFIFSEIGVYLITPFVLNSMSKNIYGYILTYFIIILMLLSAFYIIRMKLYQVMVEIDESNENSKEAKGKRELKKQDEFPPLATS